MEGTMSEIRLFAGNFEPLSWSFCNGNLISIASNTALFALIGTTYGGDGVQTFALPDLRGRVAVGVGTGPGLPSVELGEVMGTESNTLTQSNLAAHTHIVVGSGSVPVNGTFNVTMNVSTSTGGSNPEGQYLGTDGSGSGVYATTASAPTDTLNANAIQLNTSALSVNVGTIQLGVTGSSQPVDNMLPFLALNYIIAVEGIFPSRN
jgi:microcystin-dependent protein